jgi:hypothetical protein
VALEWAATTAELGSSAIGGGVNKVEKKEPISPPSPRLHCSALLLVAGGGVVAAAGGGLFLLLPANAARPS